MDDIIKLPSRGGENNYLRKLKKAKDKDSKTFLLKTEIPYLRSGKIGEDNFIDPSGGPMIIENHILPGTEFKVKSIDFIMGRGYAITFE